MTPRPTPDTIMSGSVRIEPVMLEDAILLPDPFAVLDAAGTCRLGAAAPRPDAITTVRTAMTVAPFPAGPGTTLGRFLGPVLSVAILQRERFGPLCLAGPRPTGPQIAAMAALGLAGDYLVVERPVRVDRALVTTGWDRPGRVSRLMRPAIEALRFSVEPYEVATIAAILRPAPARPDQDPVRACLAAREVMLLDAEGMRLGAIGLGITDMAAVMAAMRIVIIDDPDQAPLLGLCDPGTTVIEPVGSAGPDRLIPDWARLFALEHIGAAMPGLSVAGDIAALDRVLDHAQAGSRPRIT